MLDEILFIFTHPEVLRGLLDFVISEWLPALMLLVVVCAFGVLLGLYLRRPK